MKTKILAVWLIPFLLCGCSIKGDYTEPENLTVVTALIISKKENELELTAEITTATSEGKSKTDTIKGTQKDILGALGEVQNLSKGKLFLNQCPVVIFDTSVSGEDLKNVLLFFFEQNLLELSVRFMVCQNTDGLFEQENMQTPLGYVAEQLLQNKSTSLGITENESYVQIINKIQKGNTAFCLPLLQNGESGVYIAGICLYDNFINTQRLGISDAQLLFAVLNKLNECCVTTLNQSVFVKKASYKNNLLKITVKGKYKNLKEMENSLENDILRVCNYKNVRLWARSYSIDLPNSITVKISEDTL